MEWKFSSDSFYHMFNSQKHKKIQFWRVLLMIILQKTRQSRSVTYDVIDDLRRLGLSKDVTMICHKSIYEILIFHSINRETCDKTSVLHVITSSCPQSAYRRRMSVTSSPSVVRESWTSTACRRCWASFPMLRWRCTTSPFPTARRHP